MSTFRHRLFVDDNGSRCVELARIKTVYGTIRFERPPIGILAYIASPAEGRPAATGCLADAIRHLFVQGGASSSRVNEFEIVEISNWLSGHTSIDEVVTRVPAQLDLLDLLDDVIDEEAA